MPFGFGGSRSSSTSNSQSTDQSTSRSFSGGASQSSSEQSVAFEDIFARLFGGAEGAAAGLDPSMLTNTANQLFSTGTGFMSQIGGDAGTAFLQDRLTGGNEVLQQQIDLLGEDVGQFFNEQLLPGITSDAVAGGQLGGGRQGVAQGRAIQEAGNQFTRGATALRAGDITARDAAAGTLAGNTVAGAQVGLQGLGGLAGIADMGFSAGLSPYERLAGILGGPTVLGSSQSTAADFARAMSDSYSQSTASSTSRGRSFDIGFGSGGS